MVNGSMATEQELITLIQRVLGDRLNRIQSGVCLSGGRQGQTVTVQIGQSFHQGECWEAIEPGSRVLLAKTDQGRCLIVSISSPPKTKQTILTRLQVNRRSPDPKPVAIDFLNDLDRVYQAEESVIVPPFPRLVLPLVLTPDPFESHLGLATQLLLDQGFVILKGVQNAAQIKRRKTKIFYASLLDFETSWYSQEEVDFLEEFVRQGGGLFIQGERKPWGETQVVNSLASRFGFMLASADTNGQNIYPVEDSPMTHGPFGSLPPRLFTDAPGYFHSEDPAVRAALINSENRMLAVYRKFGRGRVVSVADANFFSNYFDTSDSGIFWLNVFAYLRG